MSKYSEIVALLEYFDRKSTPKPALKKGGMRKMMKKDFDPIEYIRSEREKVDRWEKFLKEQEKLNKKDEKKEAKAFGQMFTSIEWLVIGFLLHFAVGPAYQAMMGAH